MPPVSLVVDELASLAAAAHIGPTTRCPTTHIASAEVTAAAKVASVEEAAIATTSTAHVASATYAAHSYVTAAATYATLALNDHVGVFTIVIFFVAVAHVRWFVAEVIRAISWRSTEVSSAHATSIAASHGASAHGAAPVAS